MDLGEICIQELIEFMLTIKWFIIKIDLYLIISVGLFA